MNIINYGRSSNPDKMIVSGVTKAPDFSLKVKHFGFENGFYAGGATLTTAQLKAKGQNLFADEASRDMTLTVVTANMIDGYFSSNESAYQRGKSIGQSAAYVVCDFENQYGDYDNATNVDRLGHFLTGVKDAGALAGEFLYEVWNNFNVWDAGAKTQLTNPEIHGIGNKVVPSLGVRLSELYSFYKIIGYGVNYTTGRKGHDPRVSIYNYVYQLRVHAQLRKKGLVSKDCISIGFLWGGCDSFNAGKPPVKHRIYLDAPYNGHVSIEAHNEESLSVMKGFGLWGFVEGDGAYYWTSRIKSSDTKNDVIDILHSGYPLCSYTGNGVLPNSRPNPIRSYPFLDGLSQDVVYEAAHEISQVEEMLSGGEMTDADFAYKRGVGSFTEVVKPDDGTGVVDDYAQERPLVNKIVKGKKVLFIAQDPAARQGQITKLKLKHSNKQWLVSLNGDDPKLFQFNF